LRKPILIDLRNLNEPWPDKKIEVVIDSLFKYLNEYYFPEEYKYSKYALMGPVSKLLPVLVGEQFGNNVSSYVGYVTNIHSQQSMKRLTPKGFAELEKGVKTILEIKTEVSQREFNRIIRAIDYGVFFKKAEEVAHRIEEKKKTSLENKDNTSND
jgi:hypothetical protein